MRVMGKNKNLQPWIDYFEMLQEYEHGGFLQTDPKKHEAYVTRAALLTLSGNEEPFEATSASIRQLREFSDVVRRVRAYAGWRSQEGKRYLKYSFAMHVVKEEEPHDVLCTILLSRVRPWWCPFWKRDRIETITY